MLFNSLGGSSGWPVPLVNGWASYGGDFGTPTYKPLVLRLICVCARMCVCVSNPVPKGSTSPFALKFFQQGDCLTLNSGSPTKRLF